MIFRLIDSRIIVKNLLERAGAEHIRDVAAAISAIIHGFTGWER
jgi:hypothetical protein